jgi:hypothetical protein
MLCSCSALACAAESGARSPFRLTHPLIGTCRGLRSVGARGDGDLGGWGGG